MKIKNNWCRIAYFLRELRHCNPYKFEYIPHKQRSTKAMHSMYWREK
jgi:hypothetical protein